MSVQPRTECLLDAADLLASPDPGPTPWLVENLIVDRTVIACVGRWKTTKSYGLLDLCVSIATGEPAFGTLAIPEPGPVLYVCEESGRAALWRRLDALCRGRAIEAERLRERLFVLPNAGVKLDEPKWQEWFLRTYVSQRRSRLILFDPLARMKAPSRNESAQNEIAGVIEFLRELREAGNTAVAFVQNTGHQGEHMRGSSDLESVWETRLLWKREGKSPLVTIESEHREVEATGAIKYRIGWDAPTRTMRFNLEGAEKDEDLEERVRAYMAANPDASANEVDENVKGTRKKILELHRSIKNEGGSEPTRTTANHPLAPTAVGGSQTPPLGGLEPPPAAAVRTRPNHPAGASKKPSLSTTPSLASKHRAATVN
jgi:hypothetical protein